MRGSYNLNARAVGSLYFLAFRAKWPLRPRYRSGINETGEEEEEGSEDLIKRELWIKLTLESWVEMYVALIEWNALITCVALPRDAEVLRAEALGNGLFLA